MGGFATCMGTGALARKPDTCVHALASARRQRQAPKRASMGKPRHVSKSFCADHALALSEQALGHLDSCTDVVLVQAVH